VHRRHFHVHVHIQVHIHQEGITKIPASLERCRRVGIPIAADRESVSIKKGLGESSRVEFRPQRSNSGLLSEIQFDVCIIRL
jgi:hypothetical protein